MSLIQPKTENYTPTRAASGARSQHNGDPVAEGLAGMTVDEVKDVAEALGVEDVNKYDNLNVGQQRMNLGNRIRGAIKRIDKDIAKAQAKVDAGEADASEKKAAKAKDGETQFEAAIKPIRKEVDKREAEAAKAKEAKAKASADKKAA